MKKNIQLFISLFLLLGCQEAAFIEPVIEPETSNNALHFSDNEVVKGRMRIKLKEEPVGQVAVRSSGGIVTTGVRALDRTVSTLQITHMERVFPPAGKFEERSRREGLHLWYDVWYSEEVSATRAVGEVLQLDDIEIASPVFKIVSMAEPPEPAFMKYVSARSGELPFNDPSLELQWGYHNPGTESWQQAGADIRLADVWQLYNGDPSIIVSIVDGGIDLRNPDLQDNLWINKGEIPNNGVDDDGNGYVDDVYGYNFVSMNSTIKPQRHGTHVAGTIGATNNNEVGVCGIAGGDGTPNSGVKLMNCQIFEHPAGNYYSDIDSKNIPAAIKYGADNGAVISQNSWGYAVGTSSFDFKDPADKVAIDYFVKYAGCDGEGNQLPGSPMKGGIVFFASGNANSSSPTIAAPADYEKVIGVAAIAPDYKKAYYSNYGNYMDISAPGGTKENGIFSTTIKEMGYYEDRYGTSMSCPHVAGVAALVIEKYGVGKQGFTASQLEEILLTTAYDLDTYNPTYAGQLGHGCVNAFDALDGEVPPSIEPFTLQTRTVNNGTLSFVVNGELSGNALVTIYNGIGNLVYRKQMKTRRYSSTSIDVSALAAGYYTLQYECNKIQLKEKFIKH